MALTNKVLWNPFLLPNASAVFFTMPTDATAVMKNGRLRLSNTSGAPATVTLNCDAAGNATGTGNQFVPTVSMAANSTMDVDIPTMGPGWTLRGVSSVAGAISCVETGGTIQT